MLEAAGQRRQSAVTRFVQDWLGQQATQDVFSAGAAIGLAVLNVLLRSTSENDDSC